MRSDTLTVAGRPFALRVVRHSKARRTTLRVETWMDTVRLTIPAGESLFSAISWAKGQTEALNRAAEARPVARPFRAGALIPLEGVERAIRCDPAAGGVAEGEEIVVGGDEAGVAARLHGHLRRRAKALLTAETLALAERHGLTVASIGVGDPSSRWGSCSADGRIRYSWRLLLMPVHVRRSIVAHELAHRVHMDHSAVFHVKHEELLGASPQPAREWLRENGRALHGVGRG